MLDFYLFRTLNEVREITERWVSEYNCERPHESLNNMTPEEYRQHNIWPGSQKMPGTKTGLFTKGLRSQGEILCEIKTLVTSLRNLEKLHLIALFQRKV
ncbi:transposase [Salmonella enterica]|nr:transposase [Salmonella enterica]EHM2313440.1 transposase [Salmonella enterica]EHM2391204.1 transposase [Salmonella enterica]EHM2422817.1 transposase [Salmonella enterica]